MERRSAIAVLTFNRVNSLQATIESLKKHCPNYAIGIFDDGSSRDDTEGYLTHSRELLPESKGDRLISARHHHAKGENIHVFMGTRNLGVSGNSNRAIRWFMEHRFQHLCLCNDDFLATGDFVEFYFKAHQETQIGLWCFCDFQSESYKWVTVPYHGYKLKLLPRMTGIMMSFCRPLVENIGYFDMRFGKWGQEHCNYTNRARIGGFLNVDGQPQHCLDVEGAPLVHQDTDSSMFGPCKTSADAMANAEIERERTKLSTEGIFLPYHTEWPRLIGGRDGGGITFDRLNGYRLVTDRV